MSDVEKKCPHDRMENCPLYHLSHEVGGRGCVDDLARRCKVERGKATYEGLWSRAVSASFSACRKGLSR